MSYRGRESFSVGAAIDMGGARLLCGEDGTAAEEKKQMKSNKQFVIHV